MLEMSISRLYEYAKCVSWGRHGRNIRTFVLVSKSKQEPLVIAVASDESSVVMMKGGALVESTIIMSPISLFVVVVWFVSIWVRGLLYLERRNLFQNGGMKSHRLHVEPN